ncbi:MAG: methyltransferase domain-containing protein [Candidatus Aenigmatarchaeota archaeon]
MVKEIEKWWDEASKWFQEEIKIPTHTVHWGIHAPYEKELKLLGNVKGKRILELGCGGGQNSIALAKKGAICTGIDISIEQLKFAKKLAEKEKVKVKFIKGNFQNLSRFKQCSFDIAISAWSFQYSPNLKKLFKEVYRVLKRNGLFVFGYPNPYHDIINVKTFKIEMSYFKIGRHEEIEIWPDGSKHKFVRYQVKISDIYNNLVDAGFFVERIIEPLSLKDKSFEKYYPTKLSKLIGPTIIFKARKI